MSLAWRGANISQLSWSAPRFHFGPAISRATTLAPNSRRLVVTRFIAGDFRRAIALVAIGISLGVVVTLVGLGSVFCRVSEGSPATSEATTAIPKPTIGPDQQTQATPTPNVVVRPIVKVLVPSDSSESNGPSPAAATAAESGRHDASGADGTSRHTPHPYGSTAVDSEWEITVLQSFRGKEAWDLINHPSPRSRNSIKPGREFVLLEVSAKYKGEDRGDISPRYFGITGSSGVLWLPSRMGPLGFGREPPLDAELRSGEQMQGWFVLEVLEEERDLVLVFTTNRIAVVGHGEMHVDSLNVLIMGFGGSGGFGGYGGNAGKVSLEGAQYIALSPNAHVPYPSSPESERVFTTPSRPDDPIPSDAGGVVDQVEVRVLEVIRGAQASDWIRAVDRDYVPPEAGMDYVLVRVQTRFGRASGDPVLVASGMFGLVTADGDSYERPGVSTPFPWLDAVLYPGGVKQGWVLLQAPVKVRKLVMAVSSPFERGEDDRIYLELR